ncbi:MAG: hypothetical protein R6X05_01675 [Desulfobacterales bacterium]
MSDKDRVIAGKQARQRTMDKLSVKSGRAYTYDPNKGEGAECGDGKEDADMANLEAKARQKKADARADVERRIEKLKAKRKTVEDDLDQLRRRGGNAWEDLKAGIDSAADALGEALRSARSRF